MKPTCCSVCSLSGKRLKESFWFEDLRISEDAYFNGSLKTDCKGSLSFALNILYYYTSNELFV